MQIKYFFDKILSLLLLMILVFPLLVLILFASIDTKSFGVFFQKRIGQYGNIFTIYKLKTMHQTTNKISKIGAFFRKYKLDELLQVINVLKGDMSFVGPRPDIPGYADKLKGEKRKILELRPGVTGLASLKYFNEEAILAEQDNPLQYNDEVIYPDKVKIHLNYYYNRSFWGDIKIMFRTVFH